MTALQPVFADLHVHLGSTSRGNPVKIAASHALTFPRIMAECAYRKGIAMVGIIDAETPEALEDARALLAAGDLAPLPGGGLRYRDRTTVLLGAEVEVTHRGRPVHWVAFLPTLEAMGDFSQALGRTIKNRSLSTQRSGWSPADLMAAAEARGGVVFPAHAFTPFKSLFAAAASLVEVLGEELADHIRAVELGLSADTALADQLPELWSRTFLTDSDAHSLGRIAREYNELLLADPSFEEFRLALLGRKGRGVKANYGLDPRLGKYHRTFCLDCQAVVRDPPPVFACPRCGSKRVVAGVVDRLAHLRRLTAREAATRAGGQAGVAGAHGSGDATVTAGPPPRPPYRYQVPLEFVPGIGSKVMDRLLAAFGSEMVVLHHASREDLSEVVGAQLADRIVAAREGRLRVEVGGGGRYGKIGLT